jgi:hypothetical protein
VWCELVNGIEACFTGLYIVTGVDIDNAEYFTEFLLQSHDGRKA